MSTLRASPVAHSSVKSFTQLQPASTLCKSAGKLMVVSVVAPQTVFNVVTLAVMPLYGLMVAFPRKPLVGQAV